MSMRGNKNAPVLSTNRKLLSLGDVDSGDIPSEIYTIVIPIVAVIVILLVLWCCCCCRKSRRLKKRQQDLESQLEQERELNRTNYQAHTQVLSAVSKQDTYQLTHSSNTDHSTQRSDHDPNDNGYNLWEDQVLLDHQLRFNDIEDIQELGSGSFGVVWLIRYSGEYYASKRLLQHNAKREVMNKFIEETKLVAGLEHKNVVSFVGAAWTKRVNFQAVYEYMENGDLRSYLINPQVERQWGRDKIRIAMDVIEALMYVHSFNPPLIHRDLKSRNILLSRDVVAKVSDFGTARIQSEEATMTVEGVGTVRWLAPEVLSGNTDYTESSDVYSFGVILSELDTHELPYYDAQNSSGQPLPNFALVSKIAAGTIKPSFSESTPDRILELADRCLAPDGKDRPTAAEVQYTLSKMLKGPSYAVL